MSRAVKAHILLILVTLVWGATFVQIKDALRFASPMAFNAVRMALAAAVLAAIYAAHLRRAEPGALKAGVTTGFFLFAGYSFQTTGLQFTTPSKSAFLTGVSVVLVPVFLALFWRRPVRGWTWLGVLMAFGGLYLMTVPAGMLAGINRGDLLTFGCAISFGFQIIVLGFATRRYSFQAIATAQAITAAILLAVAMPLVETPHLEWNGRVIAAVLVTGLLCTAAAFTIQAWAQQFTSPTYTALIFALEPVFAWLTSYLVLRERLGARASLGALLILGGIVLAELKGAPEPVAP